MGAASAAKVRVIQGLYVESGTRVVLVCESSTGVWFEGNSGSEMGVRFEVSTSEQVKFIVSPAWFVGTGSGAWVRVEGAGIGTRLGFGSRVGRPAEPVSKAKVLSISGDGTEVGLLGTLDVSKVLVKLRVSPVSSAVSPLEVSSVGVEGLDFSVVFGAGVVLGPSAGNSMLITWMEGSAESTTLGQGSILELQVLTTVVHGLRSSCCSVGDVVPTLRAISEPGEDGG